MADEGGFRFRRLAIGGACVCLAAALCLVGVVVGDLFRPLPDYKNAAGAPASAAPVASTPKLLRTTTKAQGTTQTLISESGALVPEKMVSAQKQELVRAINKDWLELDRRMQAYLKTEGSLSATTSTRILTDLQRDCLEVRDRFFKGLKLQKNFQSLYDQFASRYESPDSPPVQIMEADIRLMEKESNWPLAIATCKTGHFLYPSYKGFGWERQVYYARKQGIRGTLWIAQQRIGALQRSLFSIGPDFHLPSMND